MPDPYTPSASVSEPIPVRRAVRRYVALAATLLPIAVTTLIPGITLLNQEYGWYATQSGFYDIEINGREISNAAAIRYSVGLALILLIAAILCCAIATRNGCANRRMLRLIDSSTH